MNYFYVRKSVWLFVLFLVMQLSVVKAQTQPLINSTLHGVVVDSKTKQPLQGAVISIEGTTHAVPSDRDGKFSFTTGQKFPYTLHISLVGYKKQAIVANGSPITILLTEEIGQLNDVVVVGYGTQKKVNLTGAVSTVDQKTLANRPITNSTQALYDVPGVYINQTKGRPGADLATIRIRGVGTLNNSNPLVLVDGIEFPLSDVNPNNIESISVLKDAASAAIYGNRAANGVILVTTKTGKKGKLQVDYNFYAGTQQATQYPDVVSNAVQYMEGKNRALANEGKPGEYSDALIAEYRAGTDPYIYPNTNWFDVMYRNAPIQEHNVRFSGGGEKNTFSVGLGYLNQQGVMIDTWAKKYSLNTNVTADISSRLKFGADIIGTYWLNRESSYTADEGNGEGGIMGLTYRGLPMQTPYAQDGTYADQWIRVPGHNFFRNTVALSKEGYRKTNTYRTLANVFLEYRLPLDIKYKVTVAANLLNGGEQYNYPAINLTNTKTGVISPIGNVPARGVRQISSTETNLTNFHTLNWDKSFGLQHITVLGGFSIESFNNNTFSAYNQGYLSNDLTDLNAGSTSPQVTGLSGKSRLMSYFGRVNYNFDEKYLLEGNFRYDGTSRFAAANRWGFFPSVSAGWRISQEHFIRDNEGLAWLSNLKLKASIGKLGNQNINSLYNYLDAISLGQNYDLNGAIVGGAAITQLSDKNVTWETTTASDIGLEAGFFNNKLTVELDWFNKKTSNVLRQVSVPAQVGNLAGPFRNIGTVSNKGYEVNVSYQNTIDGFRYQLGANVTYVKNRVLDLKGQVYYSGNTIIRAGDAINSFYGLQAEGIFQNTDEIGRHATQASSTKPGDIKYKDVDGNGIIDNNDRVVIGSSIPDYSYGFSLGAGYKGFDLTAIFQGVLHADTYLTGNLAQPYKNGAGVTPEWLINSWTPENPGAPLPRLTTSTGNPQNFQTSSFWIRDASYLRLKNIQLSYSFPLAWVHKISLSQLKVFVNAQNYLTISKYKFSDPEKELTRGDIIEYPNYKSITAGFNVTF
jgi:TonB-linked SusC/RagA family outer membrane protein